MQVGPKSVPGQAADAAGLVFTIEHRCRLCYTCVRECPAKAIRIKGGQAAVVDERCIACGHCVRVCTQRAKQYRRAHDEVTGMLGGGEAVAACVAPTFPLEFPDVSAEQLAGALRQLGFDLVLDAGFGVDLVTRAYERLLAGPAEAPWLSSTCPSVVGYVERHRPDLIGRLVPIVSPMIAMARCARRFHGERLRVVYVGPCLAKRLEKSDPGVRGEVDAVLTFEELHELLDAKEIDPARAEPCRLDPPEGLGLPMPFQIGKVPGDRPTIATADGRLRAYEAIDELERGEVDAKLLHLLSCRGCIMGPGTSNTAPYFSRLGAVTRVARKRATTLDREAWRVRLERLEDLDLRRTFQAEDRRLPEPQPAQIWTILSGMGRARKEDQLNCGACGYDTCHELAAAIHGGLAEPEMCLPYTVEHLRATLDALATSHGQLARAKEALAHAERLANLGQLAAGVAHEINNPLGIVLMYAHLALDACTPEAPQRGDLEMVAEQAERCRRIVAGLLDFARQNKVIPRRTDLHALCQRTLQGLPSPTGVTAELVRRGDTFAEIDPDQIAQVVTNLVVNAYDAMPDGGELLVRLTGEESVVRLEVADTGRGIAPQNLGHVFEPFFTTKPIGKGTGLGLAVTYGIVKVHRGEIRVESSTDPAAGPPGTRFTVTLPRLPEEPA